jgi:hypothetical protein
MTLRHGSGDRVAVASAEGGRAGSGGGFSLEVFQNEFLAAGATSMDAIVAVSVSGSAASAGEQAAEVLIVDTSGSMNTPPSRIEAARRAAAEAIDGIHDGVRFAVVAGTERATTIYPPWGRDLVVADPASRRAACEAVRHLEAEGGTAMSTWLHRARELFADSTASIRHVILVTDGENREGGWLLDHAIAACTGVFQADCRGIGTDWVVSELRRIASGLLGTVDVIPESEQMEAEFRALMEAAMSRVVGGAALRIWCPKHATVNFVRQVGPDVADLSGWATRLDDFTREYPLGSWGDERREYHLSVDVPANEVGVEMLAARMSLVTGADVVGQALMRAVWTDDQTASTAINREVAHYSGQAELAAAIQEGLEALKFGGERAATAKLGRAAQLAAESGHDATLRLLEKVVELEDERAGTVHIRPTIDKADEMALDTRSTRTVRLR